MFPQTASYDRNMFAKLPDKPDHPALELELLETWEREGVVLEVGPGVTNVRAGATAAFGRPWLAPVIGVQNLFDRKYVGSVAVNAAGTLATAKFYEPGPGRTLFAGFSAATSRW